MRVARTSRPEDWRFKKISRLCAIGTGAIGVVVLLLWGASHIPGVPRWNAAMHPASAFLFITASAGLYRVQKSVHDPLAQACGVVLLAAGLFHLVELALGMPHFHSGPLNGGTETMAPNTAVNFVLAGSALLLLDFKTRGGFRPSQPLLVVAVLIPMLALVGYSYRVLVLYQVGSTPMPWLTAMAFLIWCAGALSAHPRIGFLGLIISPTNSGAMMRRLLPTAILIPWSLGLLHWFAESRGFLDEQQAVALFAVSTMIVFSLLVWWNGLLLHRADLQRQRSEERLRRATANLERSNTDLQQFAYVASHDLFEPLRMITSYLQLLSQMYADRIDARGQEFIGYALDGAQRMRSLIADLLAYSRLDAKTAELAPVDCKLAAEAAMSNLKVALDESSASVSLGELPTVRGDAGQLTQLFQNLVGNAIKFHGPDKPRIEITSTRQGNDWLFSVKDNGIGISPEHFQRIFVIFQRLHSRKEYPGTGMGLAICKKIVQRHGGRIWVESSPGKGSNFRFTLPAMADPGRG